MKKFLIPLLIIIIAAVGILLLKNKNKTDSLQNEKVSRGKDLNFQIGSDSVTNAPSEQGLKYVDYSQEDYDKHKDKKRILYFHADWCPVCKPLDKELLENSNKIPENVTIFKVNYDKEPSLKTKYGVTYQHTFVQVDGSDKLVHIWSGGNLLGILENIK